MSFLPSYPHRTTTRTHPISNLKNQFSPVDISWVPTVRNLTMGVLNLGPRIEFRGSINLDGKIIPSLCLLTFNSAPSSISFSKECRQQPRAHLSSPCRLVSRRSQCIPLTVQCGRCPHGPLTTTSKSWYLLDPFLLFNDFLKKYVHCITCMFHSLITVF